MKNLYTLVFAFLYLSNFQAQVPGRKVLIEEFTTASCGVCPMTSERIQEWQLKYHSNSIVVVIHEGSGVDAMSTASTKNIFNAMKPTGGWFAPATMIERRVLSAAGNEAYLSCYKAWDINDVPGIDSVALRLMNEQPLVLINMNGNYNFNTRELSITISATITGTLPTGDWRLHLTLVEDSVIGYAGLGPFQGWDQKCYDANWAKSRYGSKFDGTYILGYPHRHVFRQALLGDWGKSGVIPNNPVQGNTYTTTVTYTLDTAYHPENLSLVGFVSSYGSSKSEKWVVNANEVKVGQNFSTGLAENEPAIADIGLKVYPNPANTNTQIQWWSPENGLTQVELMDMNGKTSYKNSIQAIHGIQRHQIPLNPLSAGVYVLKVTNSFGVYQQKLVIN